jgi:hypothetical protein
MTTEWEFVEDEDAPGDVIAVRTRDLYAWAHVVWKDGWVRGSLGGLEDGNPFRQRDLG